MTRLLQIELPVETLREAQAGDSGAQAALYRAFADAVYTLIRRLVARTAAADDLFQDTFVEVLQSLPRFRGEAPLGVWIRRIAVSKCLMYLRSPWNRRVSWLEGRGQGRGDGGDAGDAGDAQGWVDDVMDASVGDEAVRLDVQAALRKLPAAGRAVLWLHDVEGYTHEEIGELYGRTASFSKSQLMRAHLRLRELLSDSVEESVCMPASMNS